MLRTVFMHAERTSGCSACYLVDLFNRELIPAFLRDGKQLLRGFRGFNFSLLFIGKGVESFFWNVQVIPP